MPPESESAINRARLRWRCRRGTKELDIVLMRFFDQYFDTLSPIEIGDLEYLLDAQDPELNHWLFGSSPPDDPRACHIVNRIRRANFC